MLAVSLIRVIVLPLIGAWANLVAGGFVCHELHVDNNINLIYRLTRGASTVVHSTSDAEPNNVPNQFVE